MSWQAIYRILFKDMNNVLNTVEILENVEGTVTAVESIGNFKTVYPTIQNKFIPIRGSLGQFSMLSVTDQQYAGIYTEDMLKYKVNRKKGTDLVWTGYMDSECYSEPFSEIDNYMVDFAANDGFNLLERLDYVDDNGDNYTGIVTKWTVISTILSKLSLDWNALYVGLSTTIDGITLAAGETIFHKQYVIQENYINEDNDAESCRKVLEGLLRPYGAFIQQINGNLIITDVNTAAKATAQSFKKYNAQTFAYVEMVSFSMNIGDISDIKVAGTESTKDVVSGINKQVVLYSPYRNVDFLKYESKKEDFWEETGTTNYGSGDYAWSETLFGNSITWNKAGNGGFCKSLSLAGSKKDEEGYYLKIGKYAPYSSIPDETNHLSFSLKKQLPYIIPSAGYYLRIDINALFRTKTDYENPNEAGKPIYQGRIYIRVKIGNYVFVTTNTSNYWRLWNASYVNFCNLDFFKVCDYKKTTDAQGNIVYINVFGQINDQYITADKQKIYSDKSVVSTPFLIPLYGPFAGDVVEVTIYDWITGADVYGTFSEAATNDTIDCRIKKVELSVTDENGIKVENDDVEYVGTLNKKFRNEGEKVELIHGTNVNKAPFERGGILGYDGTKYYHITSWTREGVSAGLENLLLRSIEGNYKYPSERLTIKLNELLTLLGYVTYNNFLTGKKMMVTGYTVDHESNEADVTLEEIKEDYLTI